jgi:hypothetical protein
MREKMNKKSSTIDKLKKRRRKQYNLQHVGGGVYGWPWTAVVSTKRVKKLVQIGLLMFFVHFVLFEVDDLEVGLERQRISLLPFHQW